MELDVFFGNGMRSWYHTFLFLIIRRIFNAVYLEIKLQKEQEREKGSHSNGLVLMT